MILVIYRLVIYYIVPSFYYCFRHAITIQYIFIVLYYVHTRYVCAPFSSFFTLIGSSDNLDLHIQVYDGYILLIRYLKRSSCIERSLDLFICSFDLGYCSYFVLYFLFYLFDSLYCPDSALFYLIFHRIILSCVRIICIIIVTLLSLSVIYIACLGHFRLSVYTWGIFLAYVRR